MMFKDVSETDQYGRLLRYVFVDGENGVFVNYELVRRGYARIATFPLDVACESLFGDAERQATDEGLRLWSPEAIATRTAEIPTPTEKYWFTWYGKNSDHYDILRWLRRKRTRRVHSYGNPVKYIDPSGHMPTECDNGGCSASQAEINYDTKRYYYQNCKYDNSCPDYVAAATFTVVALVGAGAGGEVIDALGGTTEAGLSELAVKYL